MSPAGVIAVVAWKMWARESCRLLRVPPSLAMLLGVSTVVAAFVFGGLLAAVTVARLGDELPSALAPIVARASLAGVWLTSGLIATVFIVTAPPRTMLHSLLDLLPVARRAAAFGQLAPMAAVTTVFCVALSLPTVAVFARFFTGVDFLRGLLAIAGCIALAQVLCVAAFLLLSWSLRRGARLAAGYSDAVAAMIVMAGVCASAAGDLLTREVLVRPTVELLPHRVFAGIASTGASFGTVAIVLAWCAVATGLVVGAVSVRPASREPRTPLFLRRWGAPRGRFLAAFWFDTVTAVRTIPFISTLFAGAGVVVGAIVLAREPATADVGRALAAMAPIVPFALGVHAIGRTMSFRWIGGHIAPDRNRWAIAAAAAAAVIGLTVATLLLGALVIAAVTPLEMIPGLLARAVLGGALALFAGAAIPVTQEQPISATAAAFLFGVLLLGASIGLNTAATDWGDAVVPGVALAGAAMMAALYLHVCARHPIIDRVHA